MATSIKTVVGEVRFSYLHVFEPWSASDDVAKKYTATLLIKKSDKALVEQIKKDINKAYEAAVTEKWGGKRPPLEKVTPLRDGDEPKDDGESRGEAYEGCYYINSKSTNQPGVVDKNRHDILNSEDFYSGCFGYASIAFSGYTNAGKMGISCFLNNLMKTKDGEPLGGARTSAANDFASLNLGDDDDI